jgi:hypothetical protein
MDQKKKKTPVKVWKSHLDDLMYVCDVFKELYPGKDCSLVADAIKAFKAHYPGINITYSYGEVQIIGEYEIFEEMEPQFKIILGRKQ